MHARQIDVAGRHFEMAVDEMHQPVRQVPREVRSVVGRPVFPQPPGHVHARIILGGELDVRIRLVVAQQDVVARLALLDQVVLERQRFFLVVDVDKIDLASLADQRAGLGVRQAVVVEVAAHAAAQVLRLADIDDRSVGVLVKVHSGEERQLRGFVFQFGPRFHQKAILLL